MPTPPTPPTPPPFRRSDALPLLTRSSREPSAARGSHGKIGPIARCTLCALVGSLVVTALGALAAGREESAAVPPFVEPGQGNAPPSDAVVLFDGSDLSRWGAQGGGDPHWRIEDGELVATAPRGLVSRRKFGDVQLHVEWNNPAGGNNGLKLHERYEIQILDSYHRKAKAVGQCGAVYLQHAPLVNACRPGGQWQSYDIVFRAPRFDESGALTARGRFTVFHNGVLIHDSVEILGPTNSSAPVEPELRKPLLLTYHGAPTRFRNIWLREI